MLVYLGDNDTVFNEALREDAAVRASFDALPGMLRERVRAAGLYTPRKISAYIEALRASEPTAS